MVRTSILTERLEQHSRPLSLPSLPLHPQSYAILEYSPLARSELGDQSYFSSFRLTQIPG